VSQITVTVAKTLTLLPTGVSFASTEVEVTDNSGAVLPPVQLTGSETPPWTAVVTGTDGPGEASAVITDLDTTGNPIGSPVTLTETGTGGQPGTFQASTGGTISVTG
jgi:hypothetical protein